MLLNKIQETQQLMEETQDLQQKIDSMKKYEDFYARLINDTKMIEQFITSAMALQILNNNEFWQQDLSSIENTLDSLINSFEKEPSIRKIQELVRNTAEKENQLKTKWFDFAKHDSEEAQQILDSIKGVLQDKTEIQFIRQSLQSLSNKWPLTKQNVEQFINQYQNALNKLTELNVRPSIQQFLEKVSSNRATLGDVTDEVMEWLKEHQFSDKLYITFK
jgi:predicted S18 family serine protease